MYITVVSQVSGQAAFWVTWKDMILAKLVLSNWKKVCQRNIISSSNTQCGLQMEFRNGSLH